MEVVHQGEAKPLISVVIPTYQRPGRLRGLVAALSAQDLPASSFEVVVVDNGSHDETRPLLTELSRKTPFRFSPLEIEVNRGPAAARNLGWRAAAADLIAFTDDDCTPEPGWLSAGLRRLNAPDRPGLVQGATLPPPGFDPKDHLDHCQWRDIQGQTPYFESCNIFYRRTALEATGGFDETIGWWGEDTALGWAVVETGAGRAFERDAKVGHPVDRRGFAWTARTGLLDSTFVGLAAAHPGFRAEAFWRHWAMRREDAAFVGALAAVIGALRWRPALVAAAPYVWWRRPSLRRPHFLRLAWQYPIIDMARLAGQLTGAMRHRTFVL